jgi:hypothetical protein
MKQILTTIFMLSIGYFAQAQTNIDTEPTNNTTPGVAFNFPVNNNANISSSTDVDFYKVTVATPGVLVITTSGANTNLMSRIEVFNLNGSATANSEGYKLSTVAGVNNTLEIIAKAAGDYYIKISNGQTTTSSSPYNVSITLDNSDIYEYNDNSSALGSAPGMNVSLNANAPTIINAKLFGYTRQIMSSYAYADYPDLLPDFDVYKINVTQTGVLTMNLSNIPSNIAGSIEVYNFNGTSATSYSEGYREATVNGGALNFELLTKTIGDYYVVVYNSNTNPNGSNSSTQAYTLSMNIDTLGGEFNDNASNSTSITLNANKLGKVKGYQRNSGISYAYADFPDLTPDVDYYKTSSTIPSFMYARVSNVPANLKMKITAYASDGVTVLGSKTSTLSGGDLTLLAGDITNPSTVQYFKVQDINTLNGSNTNDQPYHFIVSTFPLSTNAINSSNSKPAYPNPTANLVQLDMEQNEYYDLITIDGKKVVSKSKQSILQLKNFGSNIFLINYYNEDGIFIRNEKIILKSL